MQIYGQIGSSFYRVKFSQGPIIILNVDSELHRTSVWSFTVLPCLSFASCYYFQSIELRRRGPESWPGSSQDIEDNVQCLWRKRMRNHVQGYLPLHFSASLAAHSIRVIEHTGIQRCPAFENGSLRQDEKGAKGVLGVWSFVAQWSVYSSTRIIAWCLILNWGVVHPLLPSHKC